MDDRFRDLAIRLMESMGRDVDRDYFTEDDAWAFIGDLAEMGKENKRLSEAAVQILRDIGLALGLRPGADERRFQPALEEQLGASPHPADVVLAAVHYARGQTNGAFEEGQTARARSQLIGGGPRPSHHPYKNYDFGED